MYPPRKSSHGRSSTQRLEEARRLRRGHYVALARRKTRQAERAALQARLVLARAL